MKKRTHEALENLAVGIEHLLDALSKEIHLRIDYNEIALKKTAKELRTALLSEPTED